MVGLLSGKDMVDDDQDGMSERDQGAFFATTGGDPPVLGSQIGLLRLTGDMGDLDQDLHNPSVAFAGLAAQPFPAALGVAGTDARPGGQMVGTGESLEIGAEFGDEDLRRPPADPRHRIEQGDRGLVLLEALRDLGAHPLHRLLQIVEVVQVFGDQEGMMGRKSPCHGPCQQIPLHPQTAPR